MLKDVPNVYTQHKPYLFEQILPDLLSDKLKESDYPGNKDVARMR